MVRSHDESETPAAQTERLQLPRIDPRQKDSHDARHAARSYYTDQLQQRRYPDTFESIGFRTELVRFVHAARLLAARVCAVETA